jgi:recombination protein RecT
MAKTKEVTKTETVSARFVNAITKEFLATAGNLPVKFDEKKKRLAQHLFIAMDAALQVLEKKRLDKGPKNNPPIVWANINMNRLAIDAMHRIELGLDALIPNHISVIPYLNGYTKKYDVDLRIGYVGNDYYRRKMAVEAPVDIIYELVHENDKLVVIKKSARNNVETYEFEIPEPFKRGKVTGGFGYILFEDPAKNKLVLVSEDEFLKYKAESKSNAFWGKWGDPMRYKTLVHRTTAKLQIDPDKVSPAYAVVEAEETALLDNEQQTPEERLAVDVANNANQEIIDLKPEPETETPKDEPEPKTTARSEDADEITAQEKAEIEAEEIKASKGPGF